MKYIFFLFFSIFFSCYVRADSIAQDALMVRFFTHLQKMTLHFEQTKTIPQIERSFKTSGIFQFEKNKGIIVRQEKPDLQTFVSTTEEFCFNNKKDSLEKLPHFSDVKDLMDHLLAGDMSDLEQIFEMSYSEKDEIWQLEVIPLRKDMKKFIQKITIKGSVDVIKRLVIEYKDGTKMDIHYTPVRRDLTDEIKC